MQLAVIRETECVGCTKCILACPVDAIIGAAQFLHTVLTDECIGCGLCVAPCPMDCIDMIELQIEPSSEEKTERGIKAKQRYQARQTRLISQEQPKLPASADPQQKEHIRAEIKAAVMRIQEKRALKNKEGDSQ
jgi:electron transport complex protein RnfB